MAEVGAEFAYRNIRSLISNSHSGLGRSMGNCLENMDLNSLPLFAGLDEKQQLWLRARLNIHVFAEGLDVIVAGPPGEVIYFIVSGSMKVYAPQPDGTDVIVAILMAGDPVGELSLVDQAGRSANVVTLEETTVLWMNRRDFQEALFSMPLLSQNLLRILSQRLRNTTSHIQVLASLDVNRRVIRQLLAFAERYGQKKESGQVFIPIRLTQGDLSELVGASRKRVNQIMVVLKRKGYVSIDENYYITILNAKALSEWLD